MNDDNGGLCAHDFFREEIDENFVLVKTCIDCGESDREDLPDCCVDGFCPGSIARSK